VRDLGPGARPGAAISAAERGQQAAEETMLRELMADADGADDGVADPELDLRLEVVPGRSVGVRIERVGLARQSRRRERILVDVFVVALRVSGVAAVVSGERLVEAQAVLADQAVRVERFAEHLARELGEQAPRG